jgi:hypothetical protein
MGQVQSAALGRRVVTLEAFPRQQWRYLRLEQTAFLAGGFRNQLLRPEAWPGPKVLLHLPRQQIATVERH